MSCGCTHHVCARLFSLVLLLLVGPEFVQMLSAEANDLCEADKKKTITPGHILRAMEKLGLERTFYLLNREGWQGEACLSIPVPPGA